MATLRFNDGTLLTNSDAIMDELFPLKIRLRYFEPGTALLFSDLPAQDILTDAEKHHIQELHDSQFEFLKQQAGGSVIDVWILS